MCYKMDRHKEVPEHEVSSVPCATECLLCLVPVAALVPALVPAPQNVSLITINTNYTLRWDWDQSSAPGRNATFTTQYVG